MYSSYIQVTVYATFSLISKFFSSSTSSYNTHTYIYTHTYTIHIHAVYVFSTGTYPHILANMTQKLHYRHAWRILCKLYAREAASNSSLQEKHDSY